MSYMLQDRFTKADIGEREALVIGSINAMWMYVWTLGALPAEQGEYQRSRVDGVLDAFRVP
ncbi:MAG: hypothetical protein ABJ246_05845 [Paracoccaceae bacterium]